MLLSQLPANGLGRHQIKNSNTWVFAPCGRLDRVLDSGFWLELGLTMGRMDI